MTREITVVIKPEDSNTGVGIGLYSYDAGDPFFIFSPLCTVCCGRLIYMNNIGPTMICQTRICRTQFDEFRGIPSSLLEHSGEWKQAYTYRPDMYGSKQDLIKWIDRWTNLVVHIEQT